MSFLLSRLIYKKKRIITVKMIVIFRRYFMPRRGENIYKRKDGRWEGRYRSANQLSGKAKYRSVYGKSYQEVLRTNGQISFPEVLRQEKQL